jgi:glycogen synthase
MNVLMTADTVGGVWTYAVDLCRALGTTGSRVTLATMGAPLSPSQRAAIGGLRHVAVHESAYRLEWMDDAWSDVDRAGEWLLDLADAERPDVVHLNGYAHALLDWRAPVLVVAHSCVVSWWWAVRHEAPPPRYARYAAVVDAALARADAVVAPSRALLDMLVRHYPSFRGGCVIPNGRAAAAPPAAAKAPLIFAAGRTWDSAKNIGTLASIAHELPWPVCVAGPAAPPDGGAAEVFPHVRQLGTLTPDEVATWLARAAIYCLPARYEPFGLSALEAALAGCALVLGDIPSLREVWGDAALFVDPDRPAELRDAIRTLADHRLLRTRLARRARQRAALYDAPTMGRRYAALHARLAARSPSEEAACAS